MPGGTTVDFQQGERELVPPLRSSVGVGKDMDISEGYNGLGWLAIHKAQGTRGSNGNGCVSFTTAPPLKDTSS